MTGRGEPARHWIIQSKLEMPRNNVRLITRPRLIERMSTWLDLDLAVVLGPAGYAKSTTVAQWCRHQQDNGSHIAWLSLDESDNEPAQFLSYIISSLSNSGIILKGLETGAEEGFFAGSLSSAMAALLDAIRATPHHVIAVLDDYHRVNSTRVDDLFKSLLQGAPRNLTVVVATRTALPFDISAMLASGRADEIGSEALRFSKDELASVFSASISEDAVSLLYERTEGWPVAVQLAKLVVSDTPSKSHLEKFHGHTGHIASYLAEQIVSGLPQQLQDFLCRTSLLERFSVQLADAVTGQSNAAELIAQLEPFDALVVRAEGLDSSFRYHHLFAEFLQTELKRRFGEEGVMDVHRRASQWFEMNGYMAEAVKHAREAQDYDRCAGLVEKAGGWELILFGGIGYLRGLLQHIPDEVAHEYPRILLAKAYLAVKDGLLAESRALFDAARNSRQIGTASAPFQRDLLNVGALIFVYEDTSTTYDELDALEAQLRKVELEDPLTRSILSCQLIVCELALGRFADADRRAQAAMRTMREARSVLGLNYCYLHAGLAALYQGRLKAADAHFGVARRMAEENFSFDPGLRALSRLLASCARYWMGEEKEVSHNEALADLDQVEHYDGWLDIYVAGLTVEALQFSTPTDAAARGYRIADRRGLTRLALIVDAFRVGAATQTNRSSEVLKLKQSLPRDIWRQNSFTWLPFLESRIGLGSYYAAIDRSKAIETLNEGLECARSFGANVHLIRLLIARATILDLSGHRAKAVDDLIEALTMAAPEQIIGPFVGQRGLVPLLRAVARYAQESYIDILVVDFANALTTRLTKQVADCDLGQSAGLSVREREVLDELANGRSNKEIARLLDMTEHTVKFHLKNVYGKLGAERRTDAVARAKQLKLI